MAENNEQIIQAQIDIDKAVKSVNDLVKVIGKSLKKIDDLSENVGKDLADNLAPIGDVRAKYKEIERETDILSKRIKEAMKIKAEVDTQSITNAKKSITGVNEDISSSTSETTTTIVEMGSAFGDLQNVLGLSTLGMAIFNGTMQDGADDSFGFTDSILSNLISLQAASGAMDSYTDAAIKNALGNVSTSMSLEDLEANLSTVEKRFELGIITQEQASAEYKRYIDAIERAKEANKALGESVKESSADLNQSKGVLGQISAQFGNLGNKLTSIPGPIGKASQNALSMASSVGTAAKSVLKLAAANPLLTSTIGAIALAWSTASDAFDNYRANTIEGNQAIRRESERAGALTAWWSEQWMWLGKAISDVKEKWTEFYDATVDKAIRMFGTREMADERRRALEMAANIAAKLNDIASKRIEYTKKDADAENLIAKLRYEFQAGLIEKEGKLVTATYEERLQQYATLKQTVEEVGARQQELLRLEYEAIKERNEIASSGEKDMQAEADAYAKWQQAIGSVSNKMRELVRLQRTLTSEGLSKKTDTVDESPMMSLDAITAPVIPTLSIDNGGRFDDMARLIYASLDSSLRNIDNAEYGLTSGTSIMDMLFGSEEARTQEYEGLEIQRLEAIIFANESLLSSTRMTEEERTRIEQENADARMAISDIELSQRERAAQGIMGMLSDLEAAFDQNTIVSKMAASANTIISGIQASQDSYTALAKIPVVGPALGIAAASASALATAKRVKDIWKVRKGDKSMPSDPSATAQAVQPSLIRPTETNMSSSDIELQKQLNQTTRVELVYSDVQNAAKRVSVVNNESSF